jgi:chromosome segregation ATPase
MFTFRTARIENKASEIKAAASAGTTTALAEQYFQELVEQRKELSKEKQRLQEERRELQRNLGGGQILWNMILMALHTI